MKNLRDKFNLSSMRGFEVVTFLKIFYALLINNFSSEDSARKNWEGPPQDYVQKPSGARNYSQERYQAKVRKLPKR